MPITRTTILFHGPASKREEATLPRTYSTIPRIFIRPSSRPFAYDIGLHYLSQYLLLLLLSQLTLPLTRLRK